MPVVADEPETVVSEDQPTNVVFIDPDPAPAVDQDVQFTCDRCDGHRYLDNPVHGGRSTRRDCATCGRTAGFPVWNPPAAQRITSVGTPTTPNGDHDHA